MKNLTVTILSIPHTAASRAEWPDVGTPCPRCGEPMGGWGTKMVKDKTPDGPVVVHRECSDGSYAK